MLRPLAVLLLGLVAAFPAATSAEDRSLRLVTFNLLHGGPWSSFRAANPDTPGPTVWQRIDVPQPTVLRRVDYVFMRPGPGWRARVLGSRVVLNAPRRHGDAVLWPSDHDGVLAEVSLARRTD